MHNVAIAEWLLSSTMSQDNAAAAAGDLAEVSNGIGFWTSVGRVAVSASFRKLVRSPLSFLWTAFLLWLAFVVTCVLYAGGAWLLWAIVYFADTHTALEWLTSHWGYHVPFVAPPVLWFWTVLVLLPAAAAWQLGADLSRKSSGVELPTWLAVAMMWTGLGLATKLPTATIFFPLACVLGGMLRRRWVGLQARSR